MMFSPVDCVVACVFGFLLGGYLTALVKDKIDEWKSKRQKKS